MEFFFVAYQPEDPIIVSSSGIPVWPVYTKKDLITFQKVCGFYGVGCIVEKNPRLAGKHKAYAEEYVVAIGETYRKEALLYAHLTNRKVAVLADMDELMRSCNSRYAIILANHKDLNAHLLEQLYTTNQVSAPGLILDYNDGHFYSQILFRSLVYRISSTIPEVNDTVVDFLPTSSAKFFTHENYILAGRDLDAESLRHILKMKKALLNVVTHSDGIDAYLGKLTLCPLKDIKNRDQPSPPLCISTGICHRSHQPVQHALQNDFLLSPLKIRTKILFWLTCRGIRLLPSSINPAWGILPVFVSNPFIGSIATPWKIIYTNLEMMKTFAAFLNESGTLGKAVASFNSSALSKGTNLKLSIVGDPNIRFHTHPTMTSVHELISANAMKDVQPEDAHRQVHFIQHYLRLIQHKTEPVKENEIDICLHLLNERLQKKKGNQLTSELLGKRILKLIAHQKNEAVVDYVKQAKNIEISRNNAACPHCQAKTDTHSISFNNKQIQKRWVTICPCCGIIEDRDHYSVSAQLKVSEGKICLIHYEALNSNWNAVLKYDFKLKRLCKIRKWPKDDQGLPKEYIRLNTKLHPGPLYITLFILQDLKFSMTRLPYRQRIDSLA